MVNGGRVFGPHRIPRMNTAPSREERVEASDRLGRTAASATKLIRKTQIGAKNPRTRKHTPTAWRGGVLQY